MNPSMGLTMGAIVGMASFFAVFMAGGWWLLLTPLAFVAMLLGIALGDRL